MKIIHFCESISCGGGIASFVAGLSSEQAKENDVTVCAVAHSTDDVAFENGVKVQKLDKQKAGFSIKFPIKIFNLLRKSNYEVVHIHSSFLYYALAIILLHRRITFVYTVHSDAKRENSSRWDRYFVWLKRWCFKHKWLHPITISRASKKSFDDLYNTNSHMIFNGICHNAPRENIVDISLYRATANSKVFLHLGRISEAKNQVVLCKAFKRLIDEGHDVVLVIAGTIQDNEIFSQIESHLSKRILYIGQRSDVLELLSQADAMCLSSIWEGLPITLLEALSVGCIPICTPVGGIVDVIEDNRCGILATSTEEEAYYAALKRYLAMSPMQIATIKRECTEEFKKYNITQTSVSYIDYYKQAMGLN
jgi:glycosyltransferase involved in cell wall biosynthesis